LKLWVEWLHDPKITALSLAERGAWAQLMTLAQECDAEGHLAKGDGSPMAFDDIARSLHVEGKSERYCLRTMLTKMEKAGSITKNSESIFLTNFVDRQSTTASDTKEAVKERVRKYREKQKALQSSSSPIPPSLSKDKDIDIEGNGVTPVTNRTLSDSNVTSNPLRIPTNLGPSSDEPPQSYVKKPDKNPYGEFQNVLLTTAEYDKLGIKFGNQKAGEMIERMSAGVASKGYKYKSHYAAILNWDNMDKKRAIGDKFHGNVGAKKQPPGVGRQINFIDGDAEPKQ
jgi:hypothetical protein